MTVEVQFKLTKSANSRAAVVLRDGDGDGGVIHLVFDANGAAHAQLDPAEDYTASWVLVGAVGDTIKLTWSAPATSGTVFEGAITAANSTPYPGGRRRRESAKYMPPVGG